MVAIVKTDSTNVDFINLVKKLDEDLAIRDGEEHAFYNQFNSISVIKYATILYYNDLPIACGAIKEFDSETMEVKRMYVSEAYRNQGFATIVLNALENWSKELNFKFLVLETGLKQPEAIRLYEKNGFALIPNYGQYIGVENSICFKKQI